MSGITSFPLRDGLWHLRFASRRSLLQFTYLPSKRFALRVLHDKSSLLLEQLNRERICDDHQHHRYIESEERSEDEEHAIVDNALSRLRHNILVVDDSYRELMSS